MEISQVFDPLIASRFKNVNGSATRNDVLLGILVEIMDCYDYPIDNFFEMRNYVRVHKDFKNIVKNMWNKIMLVAPPSGDESQNMDKFQSRHFLKIQDICKVFTILSKRYTGETIWKLLAMDGLIGDETKYYVQNLKYAYYNLEEIQPSGPEEIHVRAVRKLYDEFSDLTPAVLAENLNDVFNDVENEEDLVKSYLEKVGKYLSGIKNLKKDKKPKEKKDEGSKPKKQKLKEETADEPKAKKQKVEPKKVEKQKVESQKQKVEPKVKKLKVETAAETRLEKEKEAEIETANRIKKEILDEERIKSDLHNCLFNMEHS